MRLFDLLSRHNGAPVATGYTRLSSILAGLTPGAPLNLTSGTKLMVDEQVDDSDYIGLLTIQAGAYLAFDPTRNTRLLCDGIAIQGAMTAIGNTDAALASPLVATTAHPTKVQIDLCGDMPTVNGYTSGQRATLGIDSSLQRGFTHYFNAPLGNDGFVNDFGGVSRGLIRYAGGNLMLHGAAMPTYRRLNAHYTSGTTLVLDAPITAKAGDRLLVSPTGFFNDATRTEERTLAADVNNSATVTINAALGYARWGVLQYATDSGISTTPGTFSAMRSHVDQDPTIDERAFVCVMERRINIRGYDRASQSWIANEGFGAHSMAMGLTGRSVLKNVMFEDYGQLGLLARYGWHFHQPSYNANGTYRTDGAESPSRPGKFANFPAGAAVLDNVTFYKGHNRALTYHACRGAVADWCIAYKSVGHSFFEEEGSEEDNAWRNCVAIRPEAPPTGMVLKVHDVNSEVNSNPAGFWIANPLNEHIDCWGVDCKGVGWWNAWSGGLGAGSSPNATAALAYGSGCLGFSSQVPIYPFWGMMGTWRGMSALSCAHGGITNFPPYDNMGNTGFGGYITTTDGVPIDEHFGVFATQIRTLLEGFRLYKCGQPFEAGFCYSNRISLVEYRACRTADNYGPHFQGQTHNNSLLNHPIGVFETANHESHAINANYFALFAASYHGLLEFHDFTMYGFRGGTPKLTNRTRLQRNSVMETWDLYTDPIQPISLTFPNWKLYDSAGMWQSPPPALLNDVTTYDYIAGHVYEDSPAPIAGALSVGHHNRWALGILYDHYGTLSKGPTQAGVAGGHIVWNQPFYTTGSILPDALALEENPESIVTSVPFFGIFPARDDDTGADGGKFIAEYSAIWQRIDSTGAAISGAVIDHRPAFQPTSNPQQPDQGEFFNGFRYAAMPRNSIVRYRKRTAGTPAGPYTNRAAYTTLFNASIYKIQHTYNPNAAQGDGMILGISWSGAVPPRVFQSTGVNGSLEPWDGYYDNGNAVAYARVTGNTWAALVAATTGYFWWHDTANATLWINLRMNNTNLTTGLWVKPA